MTNVIEGLISKLKPTAIKTMPMTQAREQGLVLDLDPRGSYFQHLRDLIDTKRLKGSGLKVVADVLFGTGRDYLDTFLREAGVQVETLNGYRDAYFGGHRPEPSEEFLQDLSARVRATGAHLGLAVDADADRFGVVDAAGQYRDANTVLGLLFDYLIETRGWDGGVARSVATTHLLDRIAARYNRPVYVTKVGFKYLGEYIKKDQVVMIGEEAEGFSMKHHLPEKDGILACVLVAEMVARKGKGLPELIADLFAKVGPVYNRCLNFSLTPEVKVRLLARLKTAPARFAGLAVAEHITLDGHKYVLSDGSWVCFRASGTEPVVRFYFEASSREELERLRGAGEALIRET
jgi:phosphoglucomutase